MDGYGYGLWHLAQSFKVHAQLAKKENAWSVEKVMTTHLYYCVINSTGPEQLEAM